MRLLIPILLLGCNSSGSVVVDKVFDTGNIDVDDTDDSDTPDTDDSDNSNPGDPEDTDPNNTDPEDTDNPQDPDDTDDTDDTQDTDDTNNTPSEATDWSGNSEWSAYSYISKPGCDEDFFYEYGTFYPDNAGESWYSGCPECNQIYANYAYYGQTPYPPCEVFELYPMYRGIDYIDTTGDGQTNQVDIYYWPTGDPSNPELLGTATPATLDDGTAAWNFSYTLDIQGSDPDLDTYFVFYNWY